MRPRRQVRVTTTPPAVEPQAAVGDFVRHTRTKIKGGYQDVTRTRRGHELTIETVSLTREQTGRGRSQHETKSVVVVDARVSVRQIRDACSAVADESYECPWDDLDGYEHSLKDVSDTVGFEQNPAVANTEFWKKARNWWRPRHFVGRDDHTSYGVFCRVDRNKDLYQWLRNRGASKQVAEEMLAVDRHRVLRQLRAWYLEGYEPHGGKCELELDGETYEDSCWGFWTEEEAWEFIDTDLLNMIAWKLEEAGYVIPDLPVRDLARQKRDGAKWRYQHNVHSFDWQDQ